MDEQDYGSITIIIIRGAKMEAISKKTGLRYMMVYTGLIEVVKGLATNEKFCERHPFVGTWKHGDDVSDIHRLVDKMMDGADYYSSMECEMELDELRKIHKGTERFCMFDESERVVLYLARLEPAGKARLFMAKALD